MTLRELWDFAAERREPAVQKRQPVRRSPARWQWWLAVPFVVLLRLYQLAISPFLGAHCRFAPSCSEYARQALLRYGMWSGSLLAVRRLARCHPGHLGGWDPVP